MTASAEQSRTERTRLGLFALSQIAVMLLAISNESLWIDEFWTAHFGALASFREFYELLMVPSGSQTPLHFLHFYLWGLVTPPGEFVLRLANLPLFVAGQLAVFWALRDYPRKFACLFLALSALHPMVWFYANEARPYIMMYAGSQMILAYILNLHARSSHRRPADPGFLLCFVLGGILLFGASLLGAFWVFAASVYGAVHHVRKGSWRELMQGMNLLLLALFVVVVAVLSVYYLNSLLQGAGASRLASSTPATVVFAVYEVLGLAGVGPSRLELRSSGPAALIPYAVGLVTAVVVLFLILVVGLKEAGARLGTSRLMLMVALGLFPVAVVILSGFVMNWRVLGRHLIATLPLLNLVLALGLATLLRADGRRGQRLQWLLAVSGLMIFVYSACSLRFAQLHNKDDYRAAASLAQAALAQGERVWWAADVIGASYYGLPGQFDVMGELTGMHKPLVCSDLPGVQSIPNAPMDCLLALRTPDVVILSKPEAFDISADIAAYLKIRHFAVVQRLPAFTVWRRADRGDASK